MVWSVRNIFLIFFKYFYYNLLICLDSLRKETVVVGIMAFKKFIKNFFKK